MTLFLNLLAGGPHNDRMGAFSSIQLRDSARIQYLEGRATFAALLGRSLHHCHASSLLLLLTLDLGGCLGKFLF
jgi:hypothetical protein